MDEQTDPHRCTQILSFTWKLFTCLFTHVMLVTMVVAYCLLGAVTFENLEKENEIFVKINISFMRNNVTEDLWKFTQEAVVLRQDNWTANALARLKTFENDLVLAMRKAGWDGSEELESLQWTFTGALFYSIIVITTIGYGHIAPKTHLGKVTTIFYAIVGIPLMLLCLSNIGDIMAHSFRFLYWKVCCYSCTKEEQARNSYRQRRHRRCEVDGMKEVGPAHHGIGSSMRHKNHPQPYIATPPQGNPEVIITQNILCNKYAFEEEDYGENANHGGKKDEMDRENTNPIAKMKSPGNLGRRSQEHLNTSPRIMSPMGFIVPRQNQAKGRDRDYYLEEYNEDISGSRGIKPVPIWLCVFLVVSYIMGGAFLFSDWEDWGFADSAYFCFITLTTIGFGDFVPAQRVNNKNGEMSIALCSLYLLFGIALLAMSFNLVQEEVITNVKAVAKHLGIIKEDGEPLD